TTAVGSCGDRSASADSTTASGKRAMAAPATAVGDTTAPRLLEGYPRASITALERQAEAVAVAAGAPRDSASIARVQSVIRISKRWRAGQVLRVAFLGGSRELREQIAAAAAVWSQSANLRFDFWNEPTRLTFREWSPNDRAYRAHIRIAFDTTGYW